MCEQEPNASSTQVQSDTASWFRALVAIPIVVGLLWYGRDFLTPLVMAALVFILTDALADRIHHIRVAGWSPPRWMARLTCFLTIFVILIELAGLVSDQAEEFLAAGPVYAERISELWEQAEGILGPTIVDSIKTWIENIDVGSWITGLASQASGVLGSVFLVVLYLVFLFAESGYFAKKLPLLASSAEEAKKMQHMIFDVSAGVKQYLWINSVTSCMSAAVAYAILFLVGADFAEILALIVFLAGFIPTIGAIISLALLSLMTLLQFDTITPFLLIVFGYGGADQIISNVIQPMMQSKSLNLSAFMVMVSLAFWSTVWGITGAFLAVPIMVVVMVVCASVPGWQPWAVLLSRDGQIRSK